MKIIRYKDSADRIGHAWLRPDGTATIITGDLFGQYQITEETAEVKQLVAPLLPTAIFCIGLNYRKHAEESGAPIPEFPVVFMKNPAAVQYSGGPVEIPMHMRSTQVDYECELAVIIGRRCRNVSREKALDYVFGYTAANDVSARDWQSKWGGGQWCRGKTFDTFAPLIRTLLNGEVMQDSNTADMIFDVPRIIEFLSGSTTLLPGTVILTGTPSGIGAARKPQRFLQPGDVIAVDIEKIGLLTNPVVEENLQPA
jgi:2-keto-4-pentenoate hydratase/2-oxohepta-3-ene-1,7-dioic acid hydratase in catechol pathway